MAEPDPDFGADHNSPPVCLKEFLSLEGRGGKIQQVETVLQHVKKHLPKARVKELSSWLVSQEFQLEKMESICQARARELDSDLQQLLR